MNPERKPCLVLSMMMVVLFSCSPGDRGRSNNAQNEGNSAHDPGKVTGDSIEVPMFEIEVKLAPRAEKKLKDDHETIVVQAYFSGIPTDTTGEQYREEGRIPVGSQKVELTQPGVARFEGIKISKTDFESLANKDFEVLINIYSGRKSIDLNLLNCDILAEPISKVRGQRHTLNGDLIQ